MKIFLVCLLFITTFSVANAGIYKWVDSDGKIFFSDKKPNSGSIQKIKLKINTYEKVSIGRSNLGSEIANNVIIYSTTWCGYCDAAKKYFKKQRIHYTEYDVEKSSKGKRDYKKLGAKGVPIILVGKKRMNGFSVSGFEKIYN